jgi:hypothetical protein
MRFDADPGACKWDFSHDGQASVYTPGESDERGLPPPSDPVRAGHALISLGRI